MPSGKNETLYTSKWLKSTIEADLETVQGMISGAWLDLIPAEVNLPAVRYSVYGARDVRGNAQYRILTHIDWLILIVREGFDVAPIVPIADRLDLVLHEASGENEGVRVHCFRLEPFNMMERSDSGVQYRQVGGIYRTMVEAK